MRKSVIIGLLILTAGLFGVATTLNIIISHAMAQGYDDNYDGDASYSTYPTDDKKYECRTGPFEGFFVSSVEFCKHFKFDDDNRKDNNNNNVAGGDNGTTSIPPELATTLSVSLTIECTPTDRNPRSAQACNRITTEILPNIYNIQIVGQTSNPNRFNGSPIPVIVTFGRDDLFLVEVRVPTPVIDTIVDNIQSDLNVNIFVPTAHRFMGHCPSGEILEGESLICNIKELYTVASN